MFEPVGKLECRPGNFSYQGDAHCVRSRELPPDLVQFFRLMNNLSLAKEAADAGRNESVGRSVSTDGSFV